MKMTILVVDDERIVLDCVALQLIRNGYLALKAQSAAQALDLLRTRQGEVDLVLTDYDMGAGMNGEELLCAVRAEYPRLPVVLMTGRCLDHSLRDSFDGYIGKPFSHSELLKIIKQSLSSFSPDLP